MLSILADFETWHWSLIRVLFDLEEWEGGQGGTFPLEGVATKSFIATYTCHAKN